MKRGRVKVAVFVALNLIVKGKKQVPKTKKCKHQQGLRSRRLSQVLANLICVQTCVAVYGKANSHASILARMVYAGCKLKPFQVERGRF